MMDGKNLIKVLRRIHKHLKDVEKEYKQKNITHRIREDWGYAFYTGKFVAYLYILQEMNYPINIMESFFIRANNMKLFKVKKENKGWFDKVWN